MPNRSKVKRKTPKNANRSWHRGFISLREVRQNNLKGFDLDLPLGQLIVVTGPSGSGKSSLAFQTLYAEGQRRYIETFSPYTRQFFERMGEESSTKQWAAAGSGGSDLAASLQSRQLS